MHATVWGINRLQHETNMNNTKILFLLHSKHIMPKFDAQPLMLSPQKHCVSIIQNFLVSKKVLHRANTTV